MPSIPGAYVAQMRNRVAVAAGMATVAGLALTACGSDHNAGQTSQSSLRSILDCGGKKALKASGSSAQSNAMTRFTAAYEAACPGQTLNYTSSGSGAGISEFTGGITDFGGSDSAVKAGEMEKAMQRCGGSEVWNLPTVFGPIAVTYNVAGVDDLVLEAPTLAKIFNGSVTMWNAAEIVALNPGKSLPEEKISVLFRSDESGTTDNFQKYLDAASAGAWGKGAGKRFAGGVGEGAKGNEGTSAAVKKTPGSITYNEWSYAKNQGLTIAKIVTSAGPAPVELTVGSVSKSIDGVKVKGEGNDLELDTTSFYLPSEPGAYPIVLATYEIVCSKYPQADVPPALKAFLTAAITEGQKGLEGNGYIPIPERFKQRLTTAIAAIA